MKKIINLTLIAIFGSIVFWGCDKIEEPYLVITHAPAPDTTKHYKKVLLEDFTGHKCTNCPAAHKEARTLQQIHPGKIIVVSIHSGYFATADGSGHYTANYQTNEGTEITNEFTVTAYPSGLINRTKFSNKYLLNSDSWQSAAESQLAEVAQATIGLTTEWDNASRTVTIHTTTHILRTITGVYNLCVVLTEDSINSPQANANSSVGPTPMIDPYYHRHVLRKAINGTWGDQLNTSETLVEGTVYSKNYTFALPSGWNANHCSIVAYVRRTDDGTGKHNVIQVEETHVVPSK